MTDIPKPDSASTNDIKAGRPRDKDDRTSRARTWLGTNKIFFDTIAATFLTLAALTVGIVQAFIAGRQADLAAKQNALADKQTSLVDLQTRIAEAQALPVFEIRIVQKLNPETKRADDNFLTIDNTGGPVHEFSSRSIFYLEISAASLSAPIKTVSLSVPVDDYFGISIISAVSKGRLVTTMGYHNNAAMFALTRDLREGARGRHWMYVNSEERIYTKLFYRDILNQEHEEYYQVQPVYGGSHISNEEGRAKFKSWQPAKARHISDLSVDKVFDELSAMSTR